MQKMLPLSTTTTTSIGCWELYSGILRSDHNHSLATNLYTPSSVPGPGIPQGPAWDNLTPTQETRQQNKHSSSTYFPFSGYAIAAVSGIKGQEQTQNPASSQNACWTFPGDGKNGGWDMLVFLSSSTCLCACVSVPLAVSSSSPAVFRISCYACYTCYPPLPLSLSFSTEYRETAWCITNPREISSTTTKNHNQPRVSSFEGLFTFRSQSDPI